VLLDVTDPYTLLGLKVALSLGHFLITGTENTVSFVDR